jgi:hypothetical protein
MTKKVSKLKLKHNIKNKKTHVGRGKGNNGNNAQRPVPAPRPVPAARPPKPVPRPRPANVDAEPPTGVAARRAQLEAAAASASQSRASNRKDFGFSGVVSEARSRALIAQMQKNNEENASQQVRADALDRISKKGMPQVSHRTFTNAPPVSAQNLARAVAARAGELDYFGSQRQNGRTSHLKKVSNA